MSATTTINKMRILYIGDSCTSFTFVKEIQQCLFFCPERLIFFRYEYQRCTLTNVQLMSHFLICHLDFRMRQEIKLRTGQTFILVRESSETKQNVRVAHKFDLKVLKYKKAYNFRH
mgnify:CR=1 FL=1